MDIASSQSHKNYPTPTSIDDYNNKNNQKIRADQSYKKKKTI